MADYFWSLLDRILENKEWLFSGVGVLLIGALNRLFRKRALKKTSDFNKKQNEFSETNDKLNRLLNRLLIEREKEELFTKSSADISADFKNIGNSNYRLRIFNKGQSVAQNVKIEILEGSELFFKDFCSNFPETLEPGHDVESSIPVDNESPKKAKIKIVWDDESGKDKVYTATLNT